MLDLDFENWVLMRGGRCGRKRFSLYKDELWTRQEDDIEENGTKHLPRIIAFILPLSHLPTLQIVTVLGPG